MYIQKTTSLSTVMELLTRAVFGKRKPTEFMKECSRTP
jgi:hypothetical protein